MKFSLFAFLLSFAFLSGCATISQGTQQALVIETTPPGATARVLQTGQSCETPCGVLLSRRPPAEMSDGFDVVITMPGCRVYQTRIVSAVSGPGGDRMLANTLLTVGAPIGAATDMLSGATHAWLPNPLYVDMDCPPPAKAESGPADTAAR